MMRAIRVLFFLFLAGTACAYWTNLRYARLHILVHRHGSLHSRRLQEASLELFDEKGRPLATARTRTESPFVSFEVFHPDPAIGNCVQYDRSGRGRELRDCVKRQQYWISTWAEQVATATLTWADCTIPLIPVRVTTSMSDWWFWWLLDPHGPFVPWRHIRLEFDVNASEGCVGEQSRHRHSNPGGGFQA